MKPKSLYILFSILFLFPCLLLHESPAQVFRHFTDKDGAPFPVALGITQDIDGFLWFATTVGVYRYDSQNFKQYRNRESDPKSIPSDYVQSTYSDSKGNLWVGTWEGLSLYNREEDSFITFKHDSTDQKSLSSNVIYSILEDKKGRIWVGTSRGLDLLEHNKKNISFSRMLPDLYTGRSRRIRSMAQSPSGDLWLGTYDGLIQFEPDTKKSSIYRQHTSDKTPENNEFVSVFTDKKGGIWLGTNGNGLIRFDSRSEHFYVVEKFKKNNGDKPNVSGIVPDKTGRYWIITGAGLASFHPVTQEVQWFENNPTDPHSLVDNVLYSMHLDRQGGLWLGSYYLGFSYCDLNTADFQKVPPGQASITNSWMGFTKEGHQWFVNYERNQISFFDKRGVLQKKLGLNLESPASYYGFYLDEEDILWCGNSAVVAGTNLRTGKQTIYPFSLTATPSIKGRVRAISEDKAKNLWVGGDFGLLVLDKKNSLFKRVPSVGKINCILQDERDDLWFGGDQEVFHKKNGSEKFDRIPISQSNLTTQRNQIYRIAEDPSGRIWLATRKELLYYDPLQQKLNSLPLENKNIKDVILDVQVDNNGYLWLSSSSKLIRYHPDSQDLLTFSYRDGLPVNSILQYGSSLKDHDGLLYFVTNNEVIRIDPDRIKTYQKPSPLIWTTFKLSNQEIGIDDPSGILSRPIRQTESITLAHHQSTFSIDFALLSYLRSDGNRYAYKLEGFDPNWNETKTPSATYTNLPEGTYTLVVKAANGDGFWNPEPLMLKIKVLPPWWQTWYVYLFYLLVLAAIVFVTIRFFWLRTLFKRENELYQIKLDFFTNISHEIRTHLSLIVGPLENAVASSQNDPTTKNYLTHARKNSERLLLLVNELLDFRKIQNGGYRLGVSEYDLTRIIKHALPAFEQFASEKKIATRVSLPEEPVKAWIDSLQFQKVLYNLLGNAYKFTLQGGNVTIKLTETSTEIKIQIIDDGPGIEEQHIKDLFTSFFQVDQTNSKNQGHGIGLAISKAIIEQHHGCLEVESKRQTSRNNGETCFSIRLLKGNQHFESSVIKSPDSISATEPRPELSRSDYPNPAVDEKNKHTILLVEDNDELRSFTREMFRAHYRILESANGLAGLNVARQQLPDVIVCDIMMPEMDGLTFCQEIRKNVITSHIPLILLTAKNASVHQVEGLTAGADDYLIKPFDFEILKLKINNLIKRREELKVRFNARNVDISLIGISDVDNEFIERLERIILENISNSQFGVNEIAFQIGMSVSVLYRKLRALTGGTVNEFMKTLRMRTAYQLLESGQYQVNEVAAMVGFDDAKYFSKEFRKTFDKTPNEVRKQTIENRYEKK